MIARGPEGRNSFVLYTRGAEDGLPDPHTQTKLGFRTYMLELCKALALFLALAALILIPVFTLWKWGWAIFVVPK